MFYRFMMTSLPAFILIMPRPADAEPGEAPQTLPGTRLLQWPEVEQGDMADRLMDGAHRYVDRRIEQAIDRRSRHWQWDLSGGREAYEDSVAANRRELRRIIGVVDDRQPAVMQRFGDDRNPALVSETDAFTIHQVRWKVLRHVWGEGLLVEPRDEPAGYVIVLPDADQTPEQVMGLAGGVDAESRIARRLAEEGFLVLVPTLINRDDVDPEAMDIPADAAARLRNNPQPYREWLYRQSYHMGRHVIGYEVQKVSAAIDWLDERAGPDVRVGVAGYGEGGLVAFYAAAVDTRIDAALISGYFDWREDTWTEPLYRNVWSLLDRFGDAEIATLIAPRGLMIEHSPMPAVTGHKGRIETPAFERVRDEFARLAAVVPDDFQPRTLVHDHGQPVGPGSAEALAAFADMLGVEATALAGDSTGLLDDRREAFDPGARNFRQMQQIQNHVQWLIERAPLVRDNFFAYAVMPELAERRWSTVVEHETHPHQPFVEASRPLRQYYDEEVNGRFDDQLLPPDPRTRKVYSEAEWVGYDVVLDVFEELVAWGVLLLPRDLEPGDRRPVVVIQHGRNGLPDTSITADSTAYRNVSALLAKRGFVVFAPHNLYRTEARYRPLNRKANTVKATLYSFLLHQHDQILRWLKTLDFVDGERIAFYGNSFGGETALRVPPVLEGYALSISASYFNEWARKVAGTNDRYSYIFTDEWEVPVFDAGHTFGHAELAYLMLPRPFMVERGHHDHVAYDEWVAYEYAKVRRLYAVLGLPDRTDIEFFQGGHGMRLEGTLDFLHKHLDWPKPKEYRH